ncbi:MAG: single-stranded-DNA-specific exonuclease RecJ [SAR202 cluster bacterium]|nr:single-stranded-DNA-specific exonuclease RecJ [SAR202 cluster bacterium]MDP6715499.1 single-stranded-DNA-specific exonuclease RecJ [SAR202 cluster bacterium]
MPSAPAGFENGLGFSRIQAQLLYNRGIRSVKEAHTFMNPDSDLSHAPGLLPDILPAVRRLSEALDSGELIGIYGDFDTDGITSTALLVRAFTGLDGRVLPYLPDRVEEGHGLNNDALRRLQESGVTLLVTVDCGATATDEINFAAELGIDVIVTDHHTIHGAPPSPVALVNPKAQASQYPYQELTGVGIAFKLAQALYEELGEELPSDLMELVALGTVADVGPLTGENRYLVKEGIERINASVNPGIRALASVAGYEMGSLDASSLSFGLIPRLNAAGRLGHSGISLDLLTSNDINRATAIASELELQNRRRQSLTESGVAQADAQIRRQHPTDTPSLVVVGHATWEPGILGLIAGRINDSYYRPAIAVQIGPELSRASARSIPEFDIISALETCAPLFTKYGGHARAAGFTIPTENMRELVANLRELADADIQGASLQPELSIDCDALPSEVEGPNFEFVQRLSPFGESNPTPVFAARGIRVLQARGVGGGKHLKMRLADAEKSWDAIAFRQGDQTRIARDHIDVAYSMEWNTWQGRTTLQMVVADIKPAGR